MELNQLRYVDAVAVSGNFTRASEKLGIAQPSLSQQLIKLERELGHKLFHRLGRKAVLTEAGTVFVDRARRILLEVDDATKELTDNPTFERRITVGATPTVAPYILPSLIKRCRARHPNLQIDVLEDFRTYLVRAVLEGHLDFAIAAPPAEDTRLSIEPLAREPLLLVVAKDHPLASQPKVNGPELATETFVMLGTSSSLASQVRNFCGDNNFEPRIGLRCAKVATVKAFVAMGAGISILPRIAKAPEDKDSLIYINLHGGSPERQLSVIRHVQRYQTKGATQFLALVRETAGELVA
jgi:LysR family hydrogen peroxide-inducible transcriptional activator